MNDKLENLMYTAGLTAQGCWDNMDEYDQAAIQKFAELIIHECARKLENDGMVEVAMELKWHFGIKS